MNLENLRGSRPELSEPVYVRTPETNSSIAPALLPTQKSTISIKTKLTRKSSIHYEKLKNQNFYNHGTCTVLQYRKKNPGYTSQLKDKDTEKEEEDD